MDFKLFFVFHLEAKSPKIINNISHKIANILVKELELNITNSNDNTYCIEKEFKNWEDCIFETIKISQEIGREWIITGNISHEIDLWTNNPKIIGVKNIEVNCSNSTTTPRIKELM
jgi:hypothetical protein